MGLDAPLVAVAWQLLVCRHLDPIPPRYTLALGLTVWAIYLADRLLDSLHPPQPDTPLRHHFTRTARLPLLFLLAVPLVGLSFTLPLPTRQALPVILAVLLYFLFNQLKFRFGLSSKEVSAAAIFAAGVLLFNWILPLFLIFFCLCLWNLTAIETWERNQARLATWLSPLALLGAAFSPFLTLPLPIRLALTLSFVLCALLNFNRHRFSPLTLRVLADVVLLTPLLFR